MGYAIEFEYSFGIRYPSGETREGGANAWSALTQPTPKH